MKATLKRTGALYALIILFVAGVAFMISGIVVNGSDWAANRANQHIYSGGKTVNTGTVYDRSGEVLVTSEDGERVYNSSKAVRMATLHIVGDSSGYISTGTQSLYRSRLSGYSFVNGIYSLLSGKSDANITLNIDAQACRRAYEAFGDYNGTIIVYNYKTGSVLCSVSKPTYDVNNVPDGLLTDDYYEGVFLDKAVSGVYTPGSVMKMITAISAIESLGSIDSQSFDCDGEFECADGAVICNAVHGGQSFEEAFNHSCNSAFADITLQLGADRLLATANSLGFNSQLYAGAVRLAKSRFSPSASSPSELGWAGIGQSTTLVNPAHILAITGAVANGGTGLAPNRIKSYSTFFGSYSPTAGTLITLNPATAAEMKRLMRSNVVNKYGDDSFPDLEFCAKTGTAQLDDAASHSWIAGFSSRGNLPLAVVCVVENGGFGSGMATTVANKTLQYFLENYT